jgi:hypothetical protein
MHRNRHQTPNQEDPMLDRNTADLINALANCAALAFAMNCAIDTDKPHGDRLARAYHPVDPTRLAERIAEPLVAILGTDPWGRSFRQPQRHLSDMLDDPSSAASWVPVLTAEYVARIQAAQPADAPTLRAACDSGWDRAKRTILAADFVSLLSAVVLYLLAAKMVYSYT